MPAAAAIEAEETTPAQEYAQQIRPLLPVASRAFGSQPPGSPARVASDEVNKLVLAYADAGHKMPALAAALEPDIGLSGLRRRVRLARAGKAAGKKGGQLGRVPRKRGSTEPADVHQAAQEIAAAREQGGRPYGDAVRAAYDRGIALQAVADELGISYFALWNAKRTAY